MGMGGYLALINATPYEWTLTDISSSQMNGLSWTPKMRQLAKVEPCP